MKTMIWMIVTATMFWCAAPARALINPKFTPVQLGEGSEQILVLEFKAPDADGKVEAVVKKAVKGKSEGEKLRLNLMAGENKEFGKAVAELIRKDPQAMLFSGRYDTGDGQGADEASAMMHIGGKWWTLSAGADQGSWDLGKLDAHMGGTWGGTTDMLLRVMEFLIANPDEEIPVGVRITWEPPIEAGKVAGKVGKIQCVEIGGVPHLYVPSDGGDRLIAFADGKPADVTAKMKLTAKSRLAAWVPVGGSLALLSYDGKGLTLHRPGADGALAASALKLGSTVPLTDIALLSWDKQATRVIVAGGEVSLLTISAADGADTAKQLIEPAATGKHARALAGDFDGDGVCDVVVMAEAGGQFLKGQAGGELAAAVKSSIAGGGNPIASVADFDNNGLLDVFVASDDGNRLWQNAGKGQFVDRMGRSSESLSGEISYKPQSGITSVSVADLNNDGRPGLVLSFGGAVPQAFFNRGWRSLIWSEQLDKPLADGQMLADLAKGQQSACVGDFAGDGCLDLAIVQADGTVYVLPRAGGKKTLGVKVIAPMEQGTITTVQAAIPGRSLGAWPAGPTSATVIGIPDSGTMSLSWKTAAGEDRKQDVQVVQKTGRVELK